MIFDCVTCCAAREPQRHEGQDPYLLAGDGLWAGVLFQGSCTAENGRGPLITGRAGDILLGGGTLTVRPLGSHAMLCVRLTGFAVDHFLERLPGPRFIQGAVCVGVKDIVTRLAEIDDVSARESGRLSYDLLCVLGTADEAAKALPGLVLDALREIRNEYMSIYGVDDLSERLGVNKSHLVRTFSHTMGVTPGKYLVQVRIEAVKALLLDSGHTLETIAALCGFSGANYLCKVFKRETGLTPAAWRAANRFSKDSAPYSANVQDEIYM